MHPLIETIRLAQSCGLVEWVATEKCPRCYFPALTVSDVNVGPRKILLQVMCGICGLDGSASCDVNHRAISQRGYARSSALKQIFNCLMADLHKVRITPQVERLRQKAKELEEHQPHD